MEIFPIILQSRHLHCINQTPESAQRIHETHGFFAEGPILSHDSEKMLFESFIENDYEDKLHLTTIHLEEDVDYDDDDENKNVVKKNGKRGKTIVGKPIGIVFWREVPSDEMSGWLDVPLLAKHIITPTIHQSNGDRFGFKTALEEDFPSLDPFARKKKEHQQHGKSNNYNCSQKRGCCCCCCCCSLLAKKEASLSLVRQSSTGAIQSIQNNAMVSKDSNMNLQCGNSFTSFSKAKEEITHAWIKIELVAVRQGYYGQKIGSILLASALYQASTTSTEKEKSKRAVLHVAGGKDNIPATRLYRYVHNVQHHNTVIHDIIY
jgi:hypothetical protein